MGLLRGAACLFQRLIKPQQHGDLKLHRRQPVLRRTELIAHLGQFLLNSHACRCGNAAVQDRKIAQMRLDSLAGRGLFGFCPRGACPRRGQVWRILLQGLILGLLCRQILLQFRLTLLQLRQPLRSVALSRQRGLGPLQPLLRRLMADAGAFQIQPVTGFALARLVKRDSRRVHFCTLHNKPGFQLVQILVLRLICRRARLSWGSLQRQSIKALHQRHYPFGCQNQ